MPRKKDAATVGNAQLKITKSGIWLYDKKSIYNICNFGLKLLFRIQSVYGEISWLIAVQQAGKDDVIIALTNKEFSAPGAFHEALLRFGFVFKGEKGALDAIKEQLMPDAEQAEAISSLGYHAKSKLFFFFNGAFTPTGEFLTPDDFGMIRHEKSAYFLTFTNDLNDKDFKTFSRFAYQPGTLTLEQWTQMMAAAHGQRAFMPVCFRIAAYFRDVAFRHVNFFPLLYLQGPANAGKSTCARSLTAIDGRIQEEFNLKSPHTVKTIPRRLEQVSNSIFWADEYDNDLPSSVLGVLQAAYDGGGYQRAVNGYSNLTNSIDINSAVILTSNQIPATEYMRQRCLFVIYNDTAKSDKQSKAFERLTSREIENLSCVAAEILKHRAIIAKLWKPTHKAIYKSLIRLTSDVEHRICNNIAVLLTPIRILEKMNLLSVMKIFGKKNLLQEAVECCQRQQEILTGRSDLTQFFEILIYCAERNVLKEEEDFAYSKDGQTLAFRMARVYPVYLREFRAMYNKVGAGREELEQALERHPCFLREATDTFVSEKTGKRAGFPAMKISVERYKEHFPLILPRNRGKAEKGEGKNAPRQKEAF